MSLPTCCKDHFKSEANKGIRDEVIQKYNTVIAINGFHSLAHHRDNTNLCFFKL